MAPTIVEIVTQEVIPVLRAALTQAVELRGAVQVLAQRVEELTTELAEGELGALRRVVAAGLRALETTHNGGGRR